MKKCFKIFPVLFSVIFFLSSCEKDDIIIEPTDSTSGAYIINYGNYTTGGGASISRYDFENDELTNFYYQQQNSGAALTSVIQFACEYNDQVYMMGNNSDQLIVLNDKFEQALNGITEDIVKPRYCIADGDYLYISCWGGDLWIDDSPSYIAKFNVATNTVDQTISLPGGPEGLEIANGNLYAALNYRDSVAVIDLDDNSVTYIETPTTCSYFAKDNKDDLYVSLVSYDGQTGLGFINTETNSLSTYDLDDVSSAYSSIMAFNLDKSKLYIIAASYNANWELEGGVRVFDTVTNRFEEDSFVSGITGINGISVNPANGDVYVLVSSGATSNGSMRIYNEAGELINTKYVGIDPIMTFFLD